MTAQAELLYLPILTPARIEVSTSLARQHSPRQEPRPMLYRTYVLSPRPTQGIAYGANGRVTDNTATGHIIDIFA